jgi:hypothetical protein
MNQELEEYFNNYFSLFNTEGFKQLVEELKVNAEALSDIQSVKDAESLFYKKGQIAALATIINLEDTVRASREQAEEEAENVQDI